MARTPVLVSFGVATVLAVAGATTRERQVPAGAVPSQADQAQLGGRRGRRRRDTEGMSAEEIRRTIVELEEEMLAAADDLRFEYAAKLRDEIKSLRHELDEAEASA